MAEGGDRVSIGIPSIAALHYLHAMDETRKPADARTAQQLGVLSFMLNRVIVQQRMLAKMIAKIENRTESEVLAQMDEMLKATEAETIFYLKKYWLGEESSNGQAN